MSIPNPKDVWQNYQRLLDREMARLHEEELRNGQHRSPATPASGGAAGEPGPGDERAEAAGTGPGPIPVSAATLAGWLLTLSPPFRDPPHADIPDAGIRIGEIVGHRAWFAEFLVGGVWVLRSMAANSRWKPGIPMTADFSIQGAGVHAWKNPGQVDAYLEGWIYMNPPPSHALLIVVGTVALWGEVVEHEAGWRGQYGVPLSLDRIEGDYEHRDMILNMLRARYLRSASA